MHRAFLLLVPAAAAFAASGCVVGNVGNISGGVFVLPASDTQVVNTLIANNTGANPDVSGRVYSHGNNLIRNRTGAMVEGNIAGTDIYDADPRLVALANNGGATFNPPLPTGTLPGSAERLSTTGASAPVPPNAWRVIGHTGV